MNTTSAQERNYAVGRVDSIADYLQTLLRAVRENLDNAGLVRREAYHPHESAIEDALQSLSLAQELITELSGLGPALCGETAETV